jgi:hypothetical protein
VLVTDSTQILIRIVSDWNREYARDCDCDYVYDSKPAEDLVL